MRGSYMLFLMMRRASRTRRKTGHWAPFLNRKHTPEEIKHRTRILQRLQELASREHLDAITDERNAWRLAWWEYWKDHRTRRSHTDALFRRLDRLNGWRLALALQDAPGYIKRRYKEW